MRPPTPRRDPARSQPRRPPRRRRLRLRALVLTRLALLTALFALTTLALAPAAARAGEPWVTHAGDPIALKERRLPNGLTVLLSENHEVPRVFGAVVVRAGSRHDPADATGIAHYLEHMLFKGTARLGTIDHARERPHLDRIEALYEDLRAAAGDDARAAILRSIDREAQAAARYAIPGELDRILEGLGATEVNAFTTPDITVYHSEFPARSLDRWLAVHAERFREPVFRLFPSELESVYEEKNRSMDGLEPIADAFLARFFPGHPYGTQTTLGSALHLKNPSLRAMYAFYRRHYVAGNMALVLAGDFDADAIWPAIEEHFGTWPNAQAPATTHPPLAPFDGRQQSTIRMTPVRALGLGFRLPPPGHPDHPAVTVVGELLSNEQQAGLVDRLGRDGAVILAQAVPIPLDEHGVGLVAAVPRIVTQTFAGAERHLLAAIARVRRGEFSDAQLAAVRRGLVAREALRFETNEGRALALVETFGRGQSWRVALDASARLAAIDRAAVIDAAARYYGDDYLALRSRVGAPDRTRLQKPPLTPVRPPARARSEFARELTRVPERPQEPRFVDVAAAVEVAPVQPGVELHRTPNPFNDVYTLELRHGLGRFDRRELWVLGEYLGHAGSARRGADGFKDALFALATTLSVEATEEELVFRLQGPEEHLDAALDLLAELLEGPADDAAALRRLRRERWGRARVERAEPRVIADALREYVTFGELSRYRRDYSPRQLLHLRPKDLHGALADARGHAATVRFVGTLAAADVAARVRARVPFAAELRPARPHVVRPRIAHDQDRVFLVRRRGLLQSHVYLAVEGGVLGPAERPAALAFGEYLGGGMGGLIFQEIRELRGLAYAASGRYHEAPVAGHPGITLAYLATQADKTDDALALLRRLVVDLPEVPGRIDDVRDALRRAQEAAYPGFRELQEEIERWRWQGHAGDPRRALLAAVDDLTFAELRRFHGAHVAGRPVTVMVVADPRRVAHRALAHHGDVEVLREGQLFAR